MSRRFVVVNPSAFFDTPPSVPWGVNTSNVDVTTAVGQITDSNDVSRWEWRDANGRRVRVNIPTTTRNSGEFLGTIGVTWRFTRTQTPWWLRMRVGQGDPTTGFVVAGSDGAQYPNPIGPPYGSDGINELLAFGFGQWVNPANPTDIRMLQDAPTALADIWTEFELMDPALKVATEATHPSPKLHKLFYTYDFFSRPTLTSVASPGGATITDTLYPRITWDSDIYPHPVYSDTWDPDYPPVFKVKVFSAAQYGAGGFDPETSTATWDSGVVGTWANECVVGPLANSTTYRAYVKVGRLFPTKTPIFYPHTAESGYAHDTGGTIQWHTFERAQAWGGLSSDYVQFATNLGGPTTPTEVTPATSATITTDRPNLSMLLPNGYFSPIKGEWQLATDSGFTTNVRTVIEPDAEYRLPTAEWTEPDLRAIEQVDANGELFQTTWYIRGRAHSFAGINSAWSTGHSFTVTHVPSTGDHTPSNATSLNFGVSGIVGMGWRFADPSPYDNQSAYQIIVERVSDALEVANSGKVTSGSQFGNVTISATYKDVLLRWKVKVWDSDDVASAFSATQQFYIRDLPTVNLVYPDPTLLTVNSPSPVFKWSFSAAGGRTQQSWRLIIRNDDGTAIIYDTGWVNSVSTQHQSALNLFENNDVFLLTLMVRDSSKLERTINYVATAAWDPPPTVAFIADATPFNVDGYVEITWTNAERDGLFRSYRVYRRLAGTAAWENLHETSDIQANYLFRDYSAAAQSAHEYAVVQSAERFGVEVESVYDISNVPVAGDTYWLVSLSQPDLSVSLTEVTADSFTDEYETAEITLLDRGRRQEFGTRFGYRGALTANVWGRTNIQTIRAIKDTRSIILLRNPFGDVWQVTAGDISIERIPGVGNNEYANVTVPYVEVT